MVLPYQKWSCFENGTSFSEMVLFLAPTWHRFMKTVPMCQRSYILAPVMYCFQPFFGRICSSLASGTIFFSNDATFESGAISDLVRHQFQPFILEKWLLFGKWHHFRFVLKYAFLRLLS